MQTVSSTLISGLAIWSALVFILQSPTAHARGTAFTYQGRLDSGATEFRPTLWHAESGGSKVADNAPATLTVTVTDGLSALPLDFGGGAFSDSPDGCRLVLTNP